MSRNFTNYFIIIKFHLWQLAKWHFMMSKGINMLENLNKNYQLYAAN